MLANLLHCAIIGDPVATVAADYVPPDYKFQNVAADERIVRAAIIGTDKPRDEQRNYSSITLRTLLLKGPFQPQAAKLDVEGGYLLSDLRKTLFELYRPHVNSELQLSQAALKHRTPLFTYHQLICEVSGSDVTVTNLGFGSDSGVVGTPVRIPGLPEDCTITARTADLGLVHAKWATRPEISVGRLAASVSETAFASLRSLSSLPGPLSSDERSMLIAAVSRHILATDQVAAATLLLANAVAYRTGQVTPR